MRLFEISSATLLEQKAGLKAEFLNGLCLSVLVCSSELIPDAQASKKVLAQAEPLKVLGFIRTIGTRVHTLC